MRRAFGRWLLVLFVVVIAAMIGIRTCSVRHRTHEAKTRSPEKAGPADTTAGARPGGGRRAAERTADTTERAYAVVAGNDILLGGPDEGGTIVVGDIHNEAADGGEVRIEGESDVYGRVTSAGPIAVGSSEASSLGPSVVHGSVAGDVVLVNEWGEVRDFLDLHEWAEGVDLSGDGDLDDMNVGDTPGTVAASRTVLCAGEEIASGETDVRIANGTRSVEVGVAPPAGPEPASPDFRAFYEAASGGRGYPPGADHVVSEIPGDGEGHYFASAAKFLAWINAQQQSEVLCWRCAGDGAIDPEDATPCPDCKGSGKVAAVEIAGLFYIDDEMLDMSAIETHLVLHGTIVVAQGDPARWPRRAGAPSGRRAASGLRHPEKGSFAIGGPTRMHFTQTYRSESEGGPYPWRHWTVRTGDDAQTLCAAVPEEGRALRDFPAVAVASSITIEPRHAGFARHRGDAGDEAITILHGTISAGEGIRIGGRGGWRGEPLVFREQDVLGEDEILDETVFRIDLNDDGDTFDRLKLADVTGCPVIPAGRGRYHVDINSDGVLDTVTIGEDYGEFFRGNGYAFPILVYHKGTTIGRSVRIGGQCAVLAPRSGGRM